MTCSLSLGCEYSFLARITSAQAFYWWWWWWRRRPSSDANGSTIGESARVCRSYRPSCRCCFYWCCWCCCSCCRGGGCWGCRCWQGGRGGEVRGGRSGSIAAADHDGPSGYADGVAIVCRRPGTYADSSRAVRIKTERGSLVCAAGLLVVVVGCHRKEPLWSGRYVCGCFFGAL